MGIVLWELCAGRRAFDVDSEAALLGAASEARVPPLLGVAPWVPSALADVVHTAIARDPAKRFMSARDMAAAIEAASPIATPLAVSTWVSDVAAESLAWRANAVRNVENAGRSDERTALPVGRATASSASNREACPRARIARSRRKTHRHPYDHEHADRATLRAIVDRLGERCASRPGTRRCEPLAVRKARGRPCACRYCGRVTRSASGNRAGARVFHPDSRVRDHGFHSGRLVRRSGRRGERHGRHRATGSRCSASIQAPVVVPSPCDPPTYVDASGIQRVKRECLGKRP